MFLLIRLHIGVEVAVIGVVVVVQRELITVGVSVLLRRLGGGLEEVQNPQFSGIVGGLEELIDAVVDGLDAEVFGYLFGGDQVLSHSGTSWEWATVVSAAANRFFIDINLSTYAVVSRCRPMSCGPRFGLPDDVLLRRGGRDQKRAAHGS